MCVAYHQCFCWIIRSCVFNKLPAGYVCENTADTVKIQERRILYLYNLLQKSTCLFNLVSYGDHNAFAAVSVNAFCILRGLYSESKQTNFNLNSPVSELDSTSLPESEASLISDFRWSNFRLSGLCSLYQVFIFF